MGGDSIPMPRFFLEGLDSSSGRAEITGEDVNHIRKVLRLQKNDEIVICDGRGTDYFSVIDDITPERVSASIIRFEKTLTEPPVSITLFQGIPKSDKMDLIIQKCVELGITEIVPVSTARTVVKLEDQKDCLKKAERWQRIALEASKQTGRGIIPRVNTPVNFNQAIKIAEAYENKIIPYEDEKTAGIGSAIKSFGPGKIAVFIGPEGGFSGEEIDMAREYGLRPVTLGPRVLRTETAGMAVLAILMYELGDMGR